MRVLRWLLVAVVALFACAFAVGVVSRFSDGPIGPFAGGLLESGELVTGSVDWHAFEDVREVELGSLQPPRSRTTWLLLHEGMPYVPCAFPNFRFLKRWPHELAKDPRMEMRIDGKRYPLRAVRVTDPESYQTLLAISREKYGGGELEPDQLWYFRLEPRLVH